MKNRNFKLLSLSTIWLWLLLFSLLPILLIFITSLLSHSQDKLFQLPLTLSNFMHLINEGYMIVLLRSVSIAMACTLLCLILGYPIAYIIARSKSRFKTIFLMLIILPFWTSSLIRTYAIMTILKTHGLLNQFLLSIGVIHQPLQILYSSTAVLIGLIYDLLPFMILPLYTNIEKLEESLLEAARDLGANRIKKFTQVILPLTSSGIISGATLVFLPAMTMFYIPTLLGGAKSLLLGNLIEMQFLEVINWPLGSAISFSLIILIGLLLTLQKTKKPWYE